MRCCGKCQPILFSVTLSWIAAALYLRRRCLLVTGSMLIGFPLSSTAGSANGAPSWGPRGNPFGTNPVGGVFCVICGDETGVEGQLPGVPSGKNDGVQRLPK